MADLQSMTLQERMITILNSEYSLSYKPHDLTLQEACNKWLIEAGTINGVDYSSIDINKYSAKEAFSIIRHKNNMSLNTLKELIGEMGSYSLGLYSAKEALNKRDAVLLPFSSVSSLNFDGTNDYMDIGDSDDLLVGTNHTISTWFKNSSGTRAYMFQSRRGSTSTNLSVGVNMNASGAEAAGWIGIVIYTGSGHSYTAYDGNVDDGAWHHFAATVSDGGQKLYLDGSLIASSTNAFPNDASGHHSIIGSNSGSDRFMNGNIDEVALWNTVLDADAVTAIYNSGTPTNLTIDSGNYDNSSNLQGYWRMGDGTLDEYPLIADQTNATLGSNLQDATFNNSDLLGFTGATATGFTAVNANSAVGANDNAYGKALSLTAGDTYKLSWTTTINSYDLSQQVDVAVATSTGGGSGDTATAGTHTASGDYVNYFQAASTSTYYIAFRLGGNKEYDFTISNVSLQKVNGNAGLMNNMVSGDIEEDTP